MKIGENSRKKCSIFFYTILCTYLQILIRGKKSTSKRQDEKTTLLEIVSNTNRDERFQVEKTSFE